MPTVSRAFIKSALLFMLAALLVALLVTAPSSWGLPTWTDQLRTTHIHLFVVGWITQIIFGVALWFFPKWSREQPRGPEWIGWSCFGALNLGLILRAVTETATVAGAVGIGWSWTTTIAALLQFVAALLFVVAIWPRVEGR